MITRLMLGSPTLYTVHREYLRLTFYTYLFSSSHTIHLTCHTMWTCVCSHYFLTPPKGGPNTNTHKSSLLLLFNLLFFRLCCGGCWWFFSDLILFPSLKFVNALFFFSGNSSLLILLPSLSLSEQLTWKHDPSAFSVPFPSLSLPLLPAPPPVHDTP